MKTTQTLRSLTFNGVLGSTGAPILVQDNIPAGPIMDGTPQEDLDLIAHSAERTWWLRIPTHTGWLEIDFKKYFKN
jgi:hypothetical protein